MSPVESELAAALCDVCRLFGERRWCLATTGNYSARLGTDRILLTRSGRDKARLAPADLMVCDLDGNPAHEGATPSAEAGLHTMLYRIDPRIGAVLHTHSVTSTLASMAAGTGITFQGYEMQKALAGVDTHEAIVELPVLDNNQDIEALAAEVKQRLTGEQSDIPGFLIRGHGLYAWGSDIAGAQRHVEALEFLIECEWRSNLAEFS